MIIRNFISGGLGVNTYLVADEGTKKAFILDPGQHNNDMVKHIIDNGYEVEYIILTHGHGDHIGGVKSYLSAFPKARLGASVHERDMLKNPSMNFSNEICGTPVSLVADISVEDGEELKVGEMTLKFIHTPGHTKGGMCILIGDHLFSGDTLFAQSIGRTDFPGGSYPELKASIQEKLFVLPDHTRVYPGHMGETSIGFEKENNPFV